MMNFRVERSFLMELFVNIHAKLGLSYFREFSTDFPETSQVN